VRRTGRLEEESSRGNGREKGRKRKGRVREGRGKSAFHKFSLT